MREWLLCCICVRNMIRRGRLAILLIVRSEFSFALVFEDMEIKQWRGAEDGWGTSLACGGREDREASG